MIYTNLTKKALKISFNAHKDQVDKTGIPYVFHPFHLAEQMDDEKSTCVALLHDVVEDTDYTFDDLKNEGFTKEIIDAIKLLTHDPSVPYLDYINTIKEKEGIRDIKYKDIVILLRATSASAPIFEKELLKRNIPVFSDSANEYLDAIEIQTVISLLKVLDNPIDDISLVSVMRSKMFNFTDNEILEIRLINREVAFYNTLLIAKESIENESLKIKLNNFIDKINDWQRKSKFKV